MLSGQWIGKGVPAKLREREIEWDDKYGRRESFTQIPRPSDFTKDGWKNVGLPRGSYAGRLAEVLSSILPCPEGIRTQIAREFWRVLGMPEGEPLRLDCCEVGRFWTRREIDRALLEPDGGKFDEFAKKIGYVKYEDNDVGCVSGW